MIEQTNKNQFSCKPVSSCREKPGETLGTEHFISPRSSGQRVVVNQRSEREGVEEVLDRMVGLPASKQM
jgi:hypothetical protein